MGPLRASLAVAALSIFYDRSSFAFTAFARTRLNPRTLPAAAAAAAAAAAGTEGRESYQQQLRKALPAFAEDSQLREALAECELAIRVGEAAGIEYPVASSTAASVTSETEVDPARLESSKWVGPLDGLRRFSRDGVDGVFMGAAGVPVRYRLFPKYSPEEEGGKLLPGVVLLTGLMESMTKYGETIAHLNDSGFSVYTYDHHGQGLSGRLPVPKGADTTVAHIRDFDHYVQDLLLFSKVVLPATVPRHKVPGRAGRGGGGVSDAAAVGTADSSSASLPVNRDCYQKSGKGAGDGEQLKLSVVAHSMGGLIAVNAALREPLLFDGVVLAAPMLAPNTGKLANGIAGAVGWVATKLGQGHRSPIRRPARAKMEWSKVTHDRRRLQLWETLRLEVGCVLQRGPSFAWLSQAVGASKRGRRRFRDLSVPVLIFEAGLDRLVRSDGIERFRRRVPQARYRLFDGAYHDLFDETDDIRLEVLRETCDFLCSL